MHAPDESIDALRATAADAVGRAGEPRDVALAQGLARLGHAAFRPGQREAIEGLLDEQQAAARASATSCRRCCCRAPRWSFRR